MTTSKDILPIEDDRLAKEADELGYTMPDIPDEVSDIGEATGENWREFDDIVTDSLWFIGARSRDGAHNGQYHGNFVPQIPYQAIRRFTKPGDVVLDTFLGSGTTLIEARRLGRNGIGIELNSTMVQDSKTRISSQPGPNHTWQSVICGDSSDKKTISEVRQELKNHQLDQVQLLIMHPPYHDIVRFSNNPQDLSNAPSLDAFLESFKNIIHITYDLLEKDHFLVVVIGDKYGSREWIPLGFYTMEAVKSAGYMLKSIVVKNMEGNRAKRNLENLWRQRAFKGKYYIFKHEYVLFFQKTECLIDRLEQVVELVKAMDHQEELNLLGDSSLVPGEELHSIIDDYIWITPPKILALKQSHRIRCVVLDLTDVDVTLEIGYQIEAFIAQLPDRDKIVDVSILVKPDKCTQIWDMRIPGVSHVYADDDASLQHLARSIYVIRKTIGSGQRAGRASGFNFSESLNEILGIQFKEGEDYDWSPRRGISFQFFRQNSGIPFDQSGQHNFSVAITTKWVNGHENEKMPQIRDRYYKKGYILIAVVGPNVDTWKKLIETKGGFADFYLFVSKSDEQSLEEVIHQQNLTKSVGENSIEETDFTLVEYLKTQAQQGVQ